MCESNPRFFVVAEATTIIWKQPQGLLEATTIIWSAEALGYWKANAVVAEVARMSKVY